MNKYVNKQANKQGIENITTIMMPGASEKNSMVFLDNTKNHLTVLYKNIEEKVAFAAFPSIESINIIIGNISLAEPTIQLNFEFMAKNTKKLNDIRSDVKFTYGALKRVLKPRNIEMEYDLKTKDNFLFFNCKIKNLLNGLFDTENSN